MPDDYEQQKRTQVEISYMTQDNISWGTSEEFNLDKSNICNYVWQNTVLLGWGYCTILNGTVSFRAMGS